MFDNNIMFNWLLTTPDSAIAVKYVDLLEESNNSTHHTKKRPSPRCRLSHEESNRKDKAKHGLSCRRKEQSYKACNYESKQKALMRCHKKDDVFDDITMEEARRLALLAFYEERHNALFNKRSNMATQRMDVLREIRLLSEEADILTEKLKLMYEEMKVLESRIASLNK